jgi:hypothetical protein
LNLIDAISRDSIMANTSLLPIYKGLRDFSCKSSSESS